MALPAAVSLALALCIGAAACSNSDQSGSTASVVPDNVDLTPVIGDAIVIGSIGDASNLIPMLAGDSSSHQVAARLFDPLLTYDKTESELEPRLAERWEVSDDGLTITFYLRKDVRWHDGMPFTARDIEFGFNTIRDPDTLTAYAEDYLQVSSFTLLDDHTFRVAYEKPFAPALASWGNLVVLPKHILEGQDINEAIDFARNPVGLGQYSLGEWLAQESITMMVNPEYYRGRPNLDRIVTRIMPDLQSQFLELKSGGIDYMGLSPLQYSRQTSTPAFQNSFNKYQYISNSYTYLGYNLENPLFQDRRVRRALTHAIDKEEIVAGVLHGLGQPANVPYKPGTFWVNSDIPILGYDPDKARALLAESGWKDSDGDGVLDKDGKPFEFEIITNQGNDSRAKTATIIQQRLKEVGVVVGVRIIEWSAFINNFIDKKDFEAVVLGWSLSLDPDQYDIWHSTKTKEKQFNFVSFKNDEVDELLEKGRRTFDRTERKKYYDRFQEILNEEQPYTFLYVGYALPAISRRFQGIEPAPAGIWYNYKDWFVPKALQKYSMTGGR